jgi:hypothetical protein
MRLDLSALMGSGSINVLVHVGAKNGPMASTATCAASFGFL